MSHAYEDLEQIVGTVLCPPGCGVHTISSGSDKREWLHRHLYGTTDQAAVQQCYADTLKQAQLSAGPLLLGVPSDCGGGIQRGANWGPLYIRQHLYQQHTQIAERIVDLGDIRVIPHLLHDKYLSQQTMTNCREALYGSADCLLPVSPLSQTHWLTSLLYQQYPDTRLIALGGDHSVSYALVGAYLAHKKRQGKRCGLIHFDAHTDLSEQRLGIDLCFGTWLAQLLPVFTSPGDVFQIGLRTSAKPKEAWISRFGIQQFWMADIRELGMAGICQQISTLIEQQGIDELYVSVDIDALDSQVASATGTPELGGLSVQQITQAIVQFASCCTISGADLVEVAPMVNANARATEPQSTLGAAVDIIDALIEAIH